MKRFLSIMAIALLACIATMAATAKKTNLKVLYVGGHSDIETFGVADYDKEAHAKSIVTRTAAWKVFLETYFTTVIIAKTICTNFQNEMCKNRHFFVVCLPVLEYHLKGF